MNIVFLTYRYRPAVGGVEKYIHQLAKALLRLGHRVTVVTGAHESGLAARETDDGIEVRRYSAYRSALRARSELLRLRPVFAAADVVHISDVLMVEQYERAVGWTLPRRPIFMTRHGLSYRCPMPESERRRAAWSARRVSGIVDDGLFIAKWLGVPCDVALPQGLSPTADEIPPTPEPPLHSAVYVGRLEWDCGITHFYDAIELLDDWFGLRFTFDVYGGGTLEAELRSRAEAGYLPVQFHGWVENAQEKLSDASFAFVPGRLAIQEAMARKRVVVATHVNELRRDYVADEPFGPHLLIGASSEEIAQHVARMAVEHDERRRLVHDAFEYARTLTWERTAREYLDFWHRRRRVESVDVTRRVPTRPVSKARSSGKSVPTPA